MTKIIVEALTGSSGATLGLGIFGTLGLDALDVGLGATGTGAILGLGVIGWEALYGRSPSTGHATSGEGGFTGGIGTTLRGGFGTGIEMPRIGSQPSDWGGIGKIGFSNGYGNSLRKALKNPIIHGVCWGLAGLAAVSLSLLETEESARQNVNAETGADSIFGAALSICYGISVIGVIVRGSF